ncbi:type I toxin-antitoxin system Hok family toxin [Yersinia ruckeri]|uniref:type I toxin-antitoxin system Hok family toxin n=1 Tax=Yersinia ruckeri TaxID=29486 RepID=UPI0022352C96|nr:type I toxin-antitoxin system Hok family toxin [Yersinia ruckeri]UIN02556.1 type I toxin-antitoxin system Hok family toxin [Yersinia ruckeri]
MPSKYRYALWGWVALCFTVLCVVWMLKDRLCEVSISDGHMLMRAVVAYEVKK